MRRILWLLLALSLPAWATINAITSTRILTPCAEGQRDAAYPSGGACNPPAPAEYIETWSQFGLSDTYSAINSGTNITVNNGSKTDSSTYTFTNTVKRGDEAKSLLIANDGTTLSADGKHRAEVRYGRSMADIDTLNIDEEYCIGYSVRLSSTGWPADTKQVIVGQLANTNPYVIIQYKGDNNSDGYVRAEFQRKYGAQANNPSTESFYYLKGTDGNKTDVSGTGQWKLDRWYDVIINIIPSPADADGKLYVYIIDTSDSTETLAVNLSGTQIGFADEIKEPYFKSGIYWGSDTRSTTYRVNFGPVRIKRGASCKADVTPSGTPTP